MCRNCVCKKQSTGRACIFSFFPINTLHFFLIIIRSIHTTYFGVYSYLCIYYIKLTHYRDCIHLDCLKIKCIIWVYLSAFAENFAMMNAIRFRQQQQQLQNVRLTRTIYLQITKLKTEKNQLSNTVWVCKQVATIYLNE